jgi:ABC-type Fe3+/spermidine/putrescine transport system ATPase subunit
MNAGRIEQLSSPWDLYNRPQTLFVASFVGTANVLPTKAVNGHAGTPALRVAECFDVPRPPEQLAGGNCPWFVARPEGIAIHRDTADAILPYSARAKIRSVTMLGPTRFPTQRMSSSIFLTAAPFRISLRVMGSSSNSTRPESSLSRASGWLFRGHECLRISITGASASLLPRKRARFQFPNRPTF